MSIRFLVSHGEPDMARADRIVDVLRAAFPSAEVVGSALPAGGGTPDAAAWLRQELARTDVVAALVTPATARAQEVAFQLGAAWALGKRLVLLLDPDGQGDAFLLRLSQGEPVVLGAGPVTDFLRRVGAELGIAPSLGTGAADALGRLFGVEAVRAVLGRGVPPPVGSFSSAVTTDGSGGSGHGDEPEDDADHDTIPPAARAAAEPPPKSAVRDGLPAPSASLAAGRAFSEAVFHRATESHPAARLDASFGTFLDALGGNWGALRPLDDPEVWIEVADNVLDALTPGESHVRGWYEVGYQLSTLLNVLGVLPESEGDERQELDQLWNEAWGELQEWAAAVGFDPATVAALGQMLDNLRGPESERDYTFMAQVQEIVRIRAAQADASAC